MKYLIKSLFIDQTNQFYLFAVEVASKILQTSPLRKVYILRLYCLIYCFDRLKVNSKDFDNYTELIQCIKGFNYLLAYWPHARTILWTVYISFHALQNVYHQNSSLNRKFLKNDCPLHQDTPNTALSLLLFQLTTYSALMQVDDGSLDTYLQKCSDPCWPWWYGIL